MTSNYKKTFTLEEFTFESGKTLKHLPICFETWGELNAYRDNVILVAHALTGTSHAARHFEADEIGWWEPMIGPGRAFDTNKYFVVCPNVLGGCTGSAGPATIDPVKGTLHAFLGVRRLRCSSGGSMGGMQAMEMAALYPDFVDSIIPIAAPGCAYPQSIAYRKTQRKAIMQDPEWHGGAYYGNAIPKAGIELARMIGFITYRTEKEFTGRFGRAEADGETLSLQGRFEIEQYLEHHGNKLATWFDANTYLYLSKAMDLHDLGRGFDSYEEGVKRIKAAALVVGFNTDLLFPYYQQKEVADILKQTNPNTYYHEIETIYGHDAFLLEVEELTAAISSFLKDLKPTEEFNEVSN